MPQSKRGSVPEWAEILGRGELGRSERSLQGREVPSTGCTSEQLALHGSLGMNLCSCSLDIEMICDGSDEVLEYVHV